jgi:hypothetical protein
LGLIQDLGDFKGRGPGVWVGSRAGVERVEGRGRVEVEGLGQDVESESSSCFGARGGFWVLGLVCVI